MASGFASAQRSSELSADLPDTRTMAVQEKVERLFDAGDFKRAFFIYRNELAPIGDKYAQYMVGYMYETGMGTNKDHIVASAWYRLAAERGTPEFVAVRDQALRRMVEDELLDSNEHYLALRAEYCDLAVLLSSIKRDFKELERQSGSRIVNSNSLSTMVDTRHESGRSDVDYDGQVRRRLEARMRLLVEMGEFDNVETDPKRVNILEIERRVLEKIESDL